MSILAVYAHYSKLRYKGTKKKAHLQTFPKKNCTHVHFFVERTISGLHKVTKNIRSMPYKSLVLL